MTLSYDHKVFQFKTPSGTSRGVLTEKYAWFITLTADGKTGTGECSIIQGLSPDFQSHRQYEQKLEELKTILEKIEFRLFDGTHEFEALTILQTETSIYEQFSAYPSIIFGLETALLAWSAKNKIKYFDTAFSRGENRIPINGLVWMGNNAFMKDQLHEKIDQGYNCIKMKVGAIDFEFELDLLKSFRRDYREKDIILRVDANGAFSATEVKEKLKRLAEFNIHSIEQPIAVGQHELMAELCQENILPIALDEELIGVSTLEEKKTLLDKIKPQFIILKPSLHGGILSSKEWIKLAEERKIDWWMTSALESNLGLECIAQFTSTFPVSKHHGLGTGSLYVNNLPSELKITRGQIGYF